MNQNNSRKLTTSTSLLFALLLIVIAIPKARAQDTSEAAAGRVETPFPEPREATSSEWKPHMGVRGGYVNADQDFNGAAEFGVEAGFQPYIPFGLGMEVTRSVSDNDSDSRPDLERTNILARATYNFGGTVPILRTSYLGAGIGPVFDHDNNTDKTSLGYSVLAGFDIPLAENMWIGANSFSVGAVANYLFVSNDGPDAFGLNGSLKYWF